MGFKSLGGTFTHIHLDYVRVEFLSCMKKKNSHFPLYLTLISIYLLCNHRGKRIIEEKWRRRIEGKTMEKRLSFVCLFIFCWWKYASEDFHSLISAKKKKKKKKKKKLLISSFFGDLYGTSE